ncbi:MAG TPA: nucleotidyl transferase AbiEii/AbiGii toxin family protein [Exilispira sp.]|nr:nucleotidyl transferase AbiEii/AbiGii toxin family protein [Exilispira sp.]
MNGKNFNKIYKIQDKILNLVFSLHNSFYLTGGTAIHRFYFPYRFSNDLDFFTSANEIYYDELKIILQKLNDENIEIKIIAQVKDFARIMIDNGLQVDFVNDRTYREGKSNIINGYKIDNIENIFANKICATIDRDEEKDFFDLFVIAKNFSFNWNHIWSICNKKQIVEKSIFIQRIKTFPLIWLEKIILINPFTIEKEDILYFIEDCIYGRQNSLFKY